MSSGAADERTDTDLSPEETFMEMLNREMQTRAEVRPCLPACTVLERELGLLQTCWDWLAAVTPAVCSQPHSVSLTSAACRRLQS